MCVHAHTCANLWSHLSVLAPMRRSEDNSWSCFSPSTLGPRDWTQVVWSDGQHLCCQVSHEPILPIHSYVSVCIHACIHFFFVFEFRVFVHVKHMLCLLATPSLLGYVFCFSLTFCSMWGWTQGLMNASQMFYHCAISSALFCFCFFTFYFETGLRLVLNPSCSSGRP